MFKSIFDRVLDRCRQSLLSFYFLFWAEIDLFWQSVCGIVQESSHLAHVDWSFGSQCMDLAAELSQAYDLGDSIKLGLWR